MFGLCGGILDLPTGEDPSRALWWNAYSCGYQAYRQGKVFGANPYYNDELETRWSAGWKDSERVAMMQTWADYLDELREVGKVLPLRRENR